MSISQIVWKTSNFIFLFDNINQPRYNEQKDMILLNGINCPASYISTVFR